MKRLMSRATMLALVAALALVMGLSTMAAAKTLTMRFGHVYAPDHPWAVGMEKMAESVKARTDGRVEIQVFPAGQLGNEKDLADSISMSLLDMAIVGPGELGKRYNPVFVFDGPYTFRDVDHAVKVARGPIGRQLWDGLEEASNIRVLDALYYGTRYLTNSKRPVKAPADVQGLKLRTPTQPMNMAIVKAWGGNPTPMSLSEVYLALQQGVADGQENPIPTIVTQKFTEVQKYLSLTGHVIQMTPIVVNAKKWNGLPEDVRAVIEEEVMAAADQLIGDVQEVEKTQIEEIRKSGKMEIIEVDREAFRQGTMPVIEENLPVWGEDLYKQIQAVE